MKILKPKKGIISLEIFNSDYSIFNPLRAANRTNQPIDFNYVLGNVTVNNKSCFQFGTI